MASEGIADFTVEDDISETNYYDELQYQFFDFYYDVLSVMYDFEDDSFCELVKSVKGIGHIDKKDNSSNTTTAFDFEEEYVRCSYSLRYAVLSSSSVAHHFLDMLESEPSFMDSLIPLDKIRVTCLGGGPGTELVAISKVISDFLDDKFVNTEHKTLKLCFTIIDVCEAWEAWVTAVVKTLRNSSSLCNAKNVDIHLRFVQADLACPLNADIIKVVKKSQILTMVKLISTISNEAIQPRKKISRLFKDIALNMKPNTWIYFLDYAGGGYYQTVQKNMDQFRYYEQRESCLHENHTLDIKIPEENAQFYNHFIKSMMQRKTSTKVSSGTWLKCLHELKVVNERNFNPKPQKQKKKVKEVCVKIAGVQVRVKKDKNNHLVDDFDSLRSPRLVEISERKQSTELDTKCEPVRKRNQTQQKLENIETDSEKECIQVEHL